MSKTIKIGLDFHGVIDKHPSFFQEFNQKAREEGWQIHIITGGTKEEVVTKLKDWNISFDEIFSIMDFYEQQGKTILLQNGERHVDEKLWNQAKAQYCQEKQIDIHIDDSSLYQKWFSTPYCLYDNKTFVCQTDEGKSIVFYETPAKAIDEIKKYLA